jgi:hypothetical protein
MNVHNNVLCVAVPLQVCLSESSLYPERQLQLYDPMVLEHICSQPALVSVHSSISDSELHLEISIFVVISYH